MSLTSSEKSTIKFLIDEYKSLFQKLNLAESQLDGIEKTRRSIKNNISDIQKELSAIREKEHELTVKLISKYGKDFTINFKDL